MTRVRCVARADGAVRSAHHWMLGDITVKLTGARAERYPNTIGRWAECKHCGRRKLQLEQLN